MITNTIQELFDRKSVRVFTDQEILPEEKELILKAAAAAPTAGKQQLYTILDITDQELKDKLAETATTSHLSPRPRWSSFFVLITRNGTMLFRRLIVSRESQALGI